jgi:hypothetical protein
MAWISPEVVVKGFEQCCISVEIDGREVEGRSLEY